ncbi:MAG: (2Fe-2S)-binding protein [Candidatus Bathyarchaeota archaeon]
MICYCNQITSDEITKTVKETGYRTVGEVKNHLRETLVSNCSELNPSGQCCHLDFNRVVNEVLESQ